MNTGVVRLQLAPTDAVADGFWEITRNRLPLRWGRDTLYVAQGDLWRLPDDLIKYGLIRVDEALGHGEMRLVSR